MNLGKLLGVGKSFFGGDPTVAYRLNRRACLPKFNEGKNPFALKAAEDGLNAPAKDQTAAPKPENSVCQSSGTHTPSIATARLEPALKAPPPYAFKPRPKPGTGKPTVPPAAKPARTGWTTRLNPFRPPEPSAPPLEEQPELSLNTVKVVHNDLADAEVEVVPIKSHGEPAAAALPPGRQAWDCVGENLLKSS